MLKGLLTIQAISYLEHCAFFLFFFFACLNIQNIKLSKLEVCNLVLP